MLQKIISLEWTRLGGGKIILRPPMDEPATPSMYKEISKGEAAKLKKLLQRHLTYVMGALNRMNR